jgi:glycosyltransferase involved in cell wall biosynthesis
MIRVAIDIRRSDEFGLGTYLRNIIGSAGRLDHSNTYFLLGRPENRDEIGPLPDNFQYVPYMLSEPSPRNIVELFVQLRRLKADVFHVPHYHWIPQHLPVPHVVTVHDLVEFVYPQAGRSRWVSVSMFSLVKRSLRRAARVVAVSYATRRDIMRIFDVPGDRIEVVYNAIDRRFLQGHAAEDERRFIAERYALQHPFILYAGRVRPHKNVERIIDAFAALKADLDPAGDYGNLKLIIIGDELSKHPRLRRTVVQHRLESEVRFLGFVPIETLRVLYDCAKVFVFPSLYEGFGLPPLEAMAHGTPVITSNTSSLPEVVREAAVLVNPENVFEIVRALRQCLYDAELRSRLTERGYRQVRQYSWERSALRMIEIYNEVAAGRRAGPGLKPAGAVRG